MYLCGWEQELVLLGRSQTITDARELWLEVHTIVNESGPFRVTGHTSSYKETGGYTDPHVFANEEREKELAELSGEIEKPSVAVVIDGNANVIESHLVSPQAMYLNK